MTTRTPAPRRPAATARRTPPTTGRSVLGGVPVTARVSGGLLLLAGLVGAGAVVPTYLVVDGRALSVATGLFDVIVALVSPLVAVAVGAGLALGRVPRFGLAYAAVAGTLAVGRLLVELHQGTASTTRPGVEVLAGERVVTGSVQTAPGWTLGLVALALTVLAAVLALLAWGRTVMEDAGQLDPGRPVLAGAAVLVGVGAVLCMALPAADVPDRLVTDPRTGLVVVVTQEGPRALLERPGLALLGGLLLAGAVLLCAVVAPSLRPRLAAVGGLLAVAVTLLQAGLGGLRDARHSPDLDWTLPGVGLLLLGLAALALTAVAWRWQPRVRERRADPHGTDDDDEPGWPTGR